jgi:Fe-S-cluster containining protein
MIEQRYKEFDVAIENIFKRARAEGHTIPCKRGCDACCYEALLLMHMEMRPILKHLASMPKPLLADIRARLLDWVEGMRRAGLDPFAAEWDVHAYYRAHLACPLLDQKTNECRVYAARPVACRGHHVVDVTAEACTGRGVDGSSIPWLDIQAGVIHPFLDVLVADAVRETPGDTNVVMGLLPTFLIRLWPLIDKTTSPREWAGVIAAIRTTERPHAAPGDALVKGA